MRRWKAAAAYEQDTAIAKMATLTKLGAERFQQVCAHEHKRPQRFTLRIVPNDFFQHCGLTADNFFR